MKHSSLTAAACLLVAGMALGACQPHKAAHVADHPVKVEAIEGMAANRVTMTERAIERIDLKTDAVREQQMSRSTSLRKVVPDFGVDLRPEGSGLGIYESPASHLRQTQSRRGIRGR